MKRKLTKAEAGRKGQRALRRKLKAAAPYLPLSLAVKWHMSALGKAGGTALHAKYRIEPVGTNGLQLVDRETGERGAFIQRPRWLDEAAEREAAERIEF